MSDLKNDFDEYVAVEDTDGTIQKQFEILLQWFLWWRFH